MPVDIYTYVASNDPDGSIALCKKYGYTLQNIQTESQLGDCLAQLVKEQGEPAFRDILAMHPDRELIVEEYGMQAPAAGNNSGCAGCGGAKAIEGYLSKAGVDPGASNATTSVHQGNIFLMAGILILAIVVITRNN